MPPKQISKKRHIGGQTYPAIGSRRTKPPRPSVRGARASVTVKKGLRNRSSGLARGIRKEPEMSSDGYKLFRVSVRIAGTNGADTHYFAEAKNAEEAKMLAEQEYQKDFGEESYAWKVEFVSPHPVLRTRRR